MRRIQITVGDLSLYARLNDSPTADAIWEGLPLKGSAATWRDEIYFAIPIVLEQEEEARAEVNVGDLGFWPTGNAFCIFFGPTPASNGEQPVAASPVNVFGKIEGDVSLLKNVHYGEEVAVEKMEE